MTVKVIASPSDALASLMVTVAPSSSFMVPVPVSVEVMLSVVPETDKPTVKVSAPSTCVSSVVDTVKVSVSPTVPLKVSAVVFFVVVGTFGGGAHR